MAVENVLNGSSPPVTGWTSRTTGGRENPQQDGARQCERRPVPVGHDAQKLEVTVQAAHRRAVTARIGEPRQARAARVELEVVARPRVLDAKRGTPAASRNGRPSRVGDDPQIPVGVEPPVFEHVPDDLLVVDRSLVLVGADRQAALVEPGRARALVSQLDDSAVRQVGGDADELLPGAAVHLERPARRAFHGTLATDGRAAGRAGASGSVTTLPSHCSSSSRIA